MKPKLRLVEGLILRKTEPHHRPISAFAQDIAEAWPSINPVAASYLHAMHMIDQIEDTYGLDSAEGIVLRFLCAAQTWRGEKARKIKADLREIVKNINQELASANHMAVYAAKER